MEDDLDISDILATSQHDSDEEELTAAQVLEKLEDAWQNEKLAPDLLECKSEIVSCVMVLIGEMEKNIQSAIRTKAKSNLENATIDLFGAKRAKLGVQTFAILLLMSPTGISVSIHRMELDRVQFILRSYLRCRLNKIEIHGPVLLEREKSRGEDEPPRLSPEEFAFAKEMSANFENHMRSVVLNQMPRIMQKIDLSATIHPPNLNHYVFLKVKKREEGVLLEEDTDERTSDRVDLAEGSQFLISYKPIAALVQNGSVSLL